MQTQTHVHTLKLVMRVWHCKRSKKTGDTDEKLNYYSYYAVHWSETTREKKKKKELISCKSCAVEAVVSTLDKEMLAKQQCKEEYSRSDFKALSGTAQVKMLGETVLHLCTGCYSNLAKLLTYSFWKYPVYSFFTCTRRTRSTPHIMTWNTGRVPTKCLNNLSSATNAISNT